MSRILVLCVALAAVGALGGCVVESPPPRYPDLVYVEPGVYVLADVGPPVYYVSGVYWWYDGGVWVWSDHDRGDWHRGRPPPERLRHIHDPGAYAERARADGRHIRADEVPRPASGVQPRGRRSSHPAHRPANAVPHERERHERR
jgi:hypothetical protein